MGIDQLFISRGPGETRIACLADGRLVELHVHRAGQESVVGNIYLGRVEASLDGLDAAFVDIGLDRDGFLALPEARPPGTEGGNDGIADYLLEGDKVLVQVMRDAVEDKGAKLSTHVNLAGVNLVFRPGQPGLMVSRRMTEEERTRILGMTEALARAEGGFIVRTAAATQEPDRILAEANALVARWQEIEDRKGAMKMPHLMAAGPGPAARALRDFGTEVGRVVVDDPQALAEARAFAEAEMPSLLPRIESHKGSEPMFEAFQIEEQIEAALSPTVALAGGGSLIISQTPALTAIDVNTGGADRGQPERTAFDVNMEAARETARQLRLRNIAGLIVVDFVSLRDEGNRRRVLEELTQACADDPLAPHVAGYTRFGLVEMTRRKQGLSLQEIIGGPSPDFHAPYKSPLSVALEALRSVLREARGKGRTPTLRARPEVIAEFDGTAGAAKAEAEAALGVAIALAADHTLGQGHWEVVT